MKTLPSVPRILSSVTSDTYEGIATEKIPPQNPVKNRPKYRISSRCAKEINSHPMKQGIEEKSIVGFLPIVEIKKPVNGADIKAPNY